MKNMLVFRLMMMFFLWVGLLSAFNLYITNDNTDMINCKKICVRLSFEPGEAALYRDTFCISVDTPDLELKGWRTMAQSPVVYAEGFKKSKRLFTESFNLEILIDFDKTSKQEQGAVFNKSHLSISSLVLTKDGKNKAENVIVPLKVENIVEGIVPTIFVAQLASEYASTLLPYQKSFEFFNRNKQIVRKQEVSEVLVIDRTKGLWRDLRINIDDLIGSISFYKWYIILWVLFLLLFLCWFYPVFRFVIPLSARWRRELFVFVMVLLLVLTWQLMRGHFAPYVWYGGLSAFCVPVSIYYLWGGTATFLDRCKILIGIVFAVALLPLLALAFIHGKILILKFFL